MSLLSVEEIIELGDVSTYLSLKYKDEGKLFGSKLDGISPKSIAIVTDALKWYNESFPNIQPQKASCIISYESGGNINDYIAFRINDPIYGGIELGGYTVTNTNSNVIRNGIAQSISSSPYGYSASVNGTDITVYSKADKAEEMNGLLFFPYSVPKNNSLESAIVISPFSGGVNAFDNGSRGVANYLYWMCGKFQIEAQFIIQGVGGGIVSVLDPFATPNPLEFSVDGSSIISDGDNSATLTQFIGYNVLFVRNNVPQSTINNGGSYFSWNKTNGQFTISQAAYTGELFQIYPFI